VHLWSVETGAPLQTLQGHWAEAFDVGYQGNGLILATSGWEPSIRFWDSGSNRPIFSVHHRLFGFGSKPDMCWTIGVDRVEQWEVSANLSAFTLLGHEGSSTKHPHDVALSSDGRLAATAGDEGVRLWDLAGGWSSAISSTEKCAASISAPTPVDHHVRLIGPAALADSRDG
jgi:WD40 repeat protein